MVVRRFLDVRLKTGLEGETYLDNPRKVKAHRIQYFIGLLSPSSPRKSADTEEILMKTNITSFPGEG